jgi:hypothetical protein
VSGQLCLGKLKERHYAKIESIMEAVPDVSTASHQDYHSWTIAALTVRIYKSLPKRIIILENSIFRRKALSRFHARRTPIKS